MGPRGATLLAGAAAAAAVEVEAKTSPGPDRAPEADGMFAAGCDVRCRGGAGSWGMDGLGLGTWRRSPEGWSGSMYDNKWKQLRNHIVGRPSVG